MESELARDELVRRWQRALEKVLAESVRILRIGDCFYASSSSTPLGSHRLLHTVRGWACDCVANEQYGMPCKHLAALSTEIEIDLLRDVRLDWSHLHSPARAA